MSRIEPVILLHGGNYFRLDEPELSYISITQIAHSLSCIGRFTGHTKRFYSVAQHSVFVSYLVPQRFALHALLHDAGEAIYGDIGSPLKQVLRDAWPGLRDFLHRIDASIWAQFGLPEFEPAEVKWADLVALATEKRDLMPFDDGSYNWNILDGVEPSENFLVLPSPPEYSEKLFMDRYEQIMRGEVSVKQVTT